MFKRLEPTWIMRRFGEMWVWISRDHDDLMKGLPPVFQSVFLGQQNRPRGIAYYDSFIQDLHGKRPKEVFDRKNNGDKVIGAFCAFFPEEFVHAAGAVPLILCGGAEFPIADAEKILPRIPAL